MVNIATAVQNAGAKGRIGSVRLPLDRPLQDHAGTFALAAENACDDPPVKKRRC
jgi:hypothetical protein